MLNDYSHVTEAEIAGAVSFVAGFTPIDVGKDFVDFIAGKDIITGEKMSRWVLAGCILGPEASDQLLRNGKKVAAISDEAAEAITKYHLHHSFPKYLGGHPKQGLSEIVDWMHRELHNDLGNFAGGVLRAKTGRKGADIVQELGEDKVIEILREFYKQDKYKFLLDDFEKAIEYTKSISK